MEVAVKKKTRLNLLIVFIEARYAHLNVLQAICTLVLVVACGLDKSCKHQGR